MAEPAKPAKPRILLAEDEAAVLKMTKLRLEHEGFEVMTATDGEQVLRALDGGAAVALILMDVRMPKLDGLEVCRQLKAKAATAKIPIILFTGSTSYWQHLADRCIELGVADWLKKPFRSQELLDKIRRALNQEDGTHE